MRPSYHDLTCICGRFWVDNAFPVPSGSLKHLGNVTISPQALVRVNSEITMHSADDISPRLSDHLFFATFRSRHSSSSHTNAHRFKRCFTFRLKSCRPLWPHRKSQGELTGVWCWKVPPYKCHLKMIESRTCEGGGQYEPCWKIAGHLFKESHPQKEELELTCNLSCLVGPEGHINVLNQDDRMKCEIVKCKCLRS